MPTYPTTKTYKSGFYNAIKTGDTYDRVYTAEDVRKPYDSVFTDGLLPDSDGTAGENLKVTAAGGMSVSIGTGKAKVGGAWFENEGVYTIVLDNASSNVRYDAIIIRNDDTEDVRSADIIVRSLIDKPAVDDLVRNDSIYELCIGYVKVPALATAISASDIIDTRVDGSLCNVMSGVGAMVVRTYRETYFSKTANQKVIPIGISQYNKSKDQLTVIVEGRVFTEGTNYTITDNSNITLAVGLPVVGTKIQFEVQKNVNAAGAESVVQEVAELRTEMTLANKKLENHYYCNGATDNVAISDMVNSFMNESDSLYDDMTIYIHGTFGATAPKQGSGTSADPFIWFNAGKGGESTRRVFLDFGDCSQIVLPTGADGKYYCVFYGLETHIRNCNIIANGSGAYIYMFSSPAATMNFCEDCRFWITAAGGYISRGGTFRNCRISLTTNVSDGYVFNVLSGGLLRVFGGEYYCYAPTGGMSAIVYVNSAQTNAVAITYGMNCPTNARSGYVQSYAINCLTNSALCSFTDTITNLAIEGTGQNIRGTIKISKAGMM